MKTIIDPRLQRIDHPMYGLGKGLAGAFWLQLPFITLGCISSGPACDEGEGWEHISVSLRDRCPTWTEMCVVKNIFWTEEELVLQFHPPKSEYINVHNFVLHLWKPPYSVQLPPREFV